MNELTEVLPDSRVLLTQYEPWHQRRWEPAEMNVPAVVEAFTTHLWQTWLRWIPGPQDPPYDAKEGWVLQRHPAQPLAVLHHPVTPPTELYGAVKVLPDDALPFDPAPQTVYVVGMSARWKQEMGVDEPPMRTWRDAILSILWGWDLGQYEGWTFVATPWTCEGKRCVLFDGRVWTP